MRHLKLSIRVLFLAASLSSAIVLACMPEAHASDLSSRQQGLIEGALTYHPNLKVANIEVDVENGRAELKGVVDTHTSKALAEELAASVRGVHSVSNQLRVLPAYFSTKGQAEGDGTDNRLSNVTIGNKVKSQLLANHVTSGMDVAIETRNRIVTINGQVQSEAEKALTYWIVKNTPGVRTVINNLEIISHREQQAFVQLAEQQPAQ